MKSEADRQAHKRTHPNHPRAELREVAGMFSDPRLHLCGSESRQVIPRRLVKNQRDEQKGERDWHVLARVPSVIVDGIVENAREERWVEEGDLLR
jgi:hypothetical protein